MSVFFHRADTLRIGLLELVSAASRAWRCGVGLGLLGALGACQTGEATTNDTGAAPPSPEALAPDSAATPAAQGTATFTIDGQPEPGVSCGLNKLSTKSGFNLSFSSETLDVSITDNGKLPLAVGRLAILDWTGSVVWVIATTLPPRFNQEGPEGRGGTYFSYLGIEESDMSSPFQVYDWGAGAQPLRGREVGQLAFTRLSNGTADGSFQSAVYIQMGGVKPTQYQGKDRLLHRMKEHQLKGTFQNVPVFDPQKALRGEQ